MGFDIRIPIGMMFSLFGLLISCYGLATRASPMYQHHSLGVNVNLWWGLVMLAFGVALLLLSRRKPAGQVSIAHQGGDPDDLRENTH